jgi:ribose-phosphate pyrophosphokinase
MYKIHKYPDGASYVEVTRFDKEFVFRLNSYEDLWYLNQVVDTYNHAGLVPTITIPNLIDAQADRRFASNQNAGLKLVCDFLSRLHADFRVFHPHNPEVVEALLPKAVITDNKKFIREVELNLRVGLTKKKKQDSREGSKEKDYRYNIENRLVFMSSDAGGYKPLMKLCDAINWQGETFSASKARVYRDGKSLISQRVDKKDFEGKDIMIVDDICVYGGTFKGLSKLLRQRNCGNLYLAVSHMTIQHHPQDSVFECFDKVFTTNSKYNEYTAENSEREMLVPENLQIIKMFND